MYISNPIDLTSVPKRNKSRVYIKSVNRSNNLRRWVPRMIDFVNHIRKPFFKWSIYLNLRIISGRDISNGQNYRSNNLRQWVPVKIDFVNHIKKTTSRTVLKGKKCHLNLTSEASQVVDKYATQSPFEFHRCCDCIGKIQPNMCPIESSRQLN